METLDCDSFRVCMGLAGEVLAKKPEAEYVIATTCFHRTDELANLQDAGFSFHDRFLQIEINIAGAKKRIAEMPAAADGIIVAETSDFTEEMFGIACSAFGTDRRFHLDADFAHREYAAEVIAAAVRRCLDHGTRIICASHGKDVLGCVMILDDSPGGYCTNVLGFTKPGLKGRLAALPLYAGAMGMLKSETYSGKISTTNAASLNLHAGFGAKVTGAEDWYILRKAGNKLC